MAAIVGEPWRGLTKVALNGADGDRFYTLSFEDVVPSTVDGDRAEWEGSPGQEFTLRLEWETTGAPLYAQANSFTVRMKLPGDNVNIGQAWAETLSGDNGVVTKTFHFDDEPVAGSVVGALRAGMLEMHLLVQDTEGASTWTVDSRGATSNPPTGVGHDWARGYVRALPTLESHSLSNVALGGAEPALFAFDDEVHLEVLADADFYRQQGTTGAILFDGAVRGVSLIHNTTSRAKQFSWIADGERIDESHVEVGSYDIRVWLPVTDFGGDSEYDWAGVNEPSWTLVGERAVYSDRMDIDSRLSVDHHMQLNDNVFGTPPGTKDNSNKERLTSDLAFVGARIVNANGEGVNGLTLSEVLEDAQSLVARAVDRSVTTQAQGGEDGWVASLASWDSALPGGVWNHTINVTGPPYADGAELINPVEQFTLLALNPNYKVVTGGGTASAPVTGDHWHPGEDLLVGFAVFNLAGNTTVPVDDSDVLDPGGQPYPRAYMIVARFNVGLGRAEFFDQDGTWQPMEPDGAAYQWQLMSIRRGNQLTGVGDVGDERTYVHKFTPAETEGWGNADLFFIPVTYIDSTPYSTFGAGAALAGDNAHDGYGMDPVGLALSGALGQR